MARIPGFEAQKMIIDATDAESESTLANRSGLSIAQVSSLLKSYVVVPKTRASAFDSQALDVLRKQLVDAQQENSQLRQLIRERDIEIERLQALLKERDKAYENGCPYKKIAQDPA